MTLTEAEKAIYTRIGQFSGVEKQHLRISNQPTINGKPFEPPKDKPWCVVSIQYGGASIAGIGNKPCIRNAGFISIQCFTPKNTGTLAMTNLCEAWVNHLQSYSIDSLEIYLVHPPLDMDEENFYAKIVRAEFRVN